jgi:hypothetical protein
MNVLRARGKRLWVPIHTRNLDARGVKAVESRGNNLRHIDHEMKSAGDLISGQFTGTQSHSSPKEKF